MRTFSGHLSSIFSVAFSSDLNYVLTGSGDYTARLWDINTGEQLRNFSGHRSEVYSVAFSPDGKFVLTGSNDSTARLWDVNYQDTMRTACFLIIRDFTTEERNRYQIDNIPTCP